MNKLKGFTLIELLVVIAILGVLAGGILVAINPLEQLNRGRDAGRKSTISQLGNAVQAYYTSQGAIYPTGSTSWMSDLVSAGELRNTPENAIGGNYTDPSCTGSFNQNGYCYNENGTDAVVYAPAEAMGTKTAVGCTSAETAWIVWSSAEGKTGVVCIDGSEPSPGITGLE